MKQVTVYQTNTTTGKSEDIGTISLQNGRLVPSPKSRILQNIIKGTVIDPDTEMKLKEVEDPELFLSLLCKEYNGSYLRISKVEDK
jgi:hypothetical protein